MTEPSPPLTPCIDVCQLHPLARVCLGCERSIDEIVAWPRLDNGERARIMAGLPARKAERLRAQRASSDLARQAQAQQQQ